MKDIRIYDFEFNLLHIEHNIISSNWSLKFNGVGTFEAHFSPLSDIVEAVITRPYLVAVQGEYQAVITGKQLGGDFVLFGRTVNWLLSKRVTPPFRVEDLEIDDNTASIAFWVVSQAFADTPEFVLESISPLLNKPQNTWRRINHATHEVLEDLLATEGAGYSLLFDIPNKKWRFFVNTEKHTELVVSESNKNAYDTSYTEDIQRLATGGFYDLEPEDKGDWNAKSNYPMLTNNAARNFCKFYTVSVAGVWFGINFEVGDYISCLTPDGAWQKTTNISNITTYISADQTKTGIYKWDEILGGETEDEAQISLSKKRFDQSIRLKTRKLRFGTDYCLGDILRVQMVEGGFRQSVQQKVMGVDLWFEHNNVGERPQLENWETTDETR